MSRALLFLVIFAAGCRSCSERLVRSPDYRCGQPCYGGGANLAGKGQCTYGRWSCPEDGGDSVCEGWGQSEWETCDGIDNDCDGKVDRFYEDCENACGKGTRGCKDGEWGVCWKRDSYGFMEPLVPRDGGEVCNGRDDDCDGIIDNNLPSEYCYDGPAGTLVPTAECHPGFRQCNYGSWECANQQLPRAETCDGKDNDCDGAIDDGLGHQYDFLFCIDTSGSMCGTVSEVQRAVAAFTNKYNSPDHRFALCSFSTTGRSRQTIILQNFGPPAPFITAVNRLDCSGDGDEGSMDALWYASQPAPFKLVDGGTEALTWRPGARKFALIFSDEPAHAFDPATPVTVDTSGANNVIDDGTQEVAVDLAIAGVQAHVWTGLTYSATYSPAQPVLHDIYSSMLQSDLNAVLGSACQ